MKPTLHLKPAARGSAQAATRTEIRLGRQIAARAAERSAPAGAALLCAAWLGAGGCSSVPAPRLRDATVTPGPRTAEGQVLIIRVIADNPGREPLPLREVNYALAINGREVFRGRRSAEGTVRRFGSQEIRLPAVIPASQFGPDGALPTGDVSYRVDGAVTYIRPGALSRTLFDADVIRPSVSLDASGKVPL